MDNNQINFEVVVKPDENQKSIYSENAFPAISNLADYKPNMDKNVEAARKLERLNITVHHIGEFSISASCDFSKFEEAFQTKIRTHKFVTEEIVDDNKELILQSPGKEDSFSVPKEEDLDNLIERAYIQHKPQFFQNERPLPPFWDDSFRLRVPGDVAQIMQASAVHRMGFTGSGVRVVMPDSGFYHHPYFDEQGYNFLSVCTPDATDHTTDFSGHGTGECANLFATAPGINFIGLKMNNPTLAIKTAVDLRADIITCSWGYSMDVPNSQMPNWLRPLYLAVLDAVSKGIVVCFSAGNGHFGFPGSMPEVISVGGVIVDQNLQYSATRYASGFYSTWFPGRRTPDICGLCGELPRADYIVLPVMENAALEKSDGWGAFSGTSAASPMVAGVCALLKEIDESLSPNEIRNILQYTARDISQGTNAHGNVAQAGPDGATGFGLVSAERAVNALI